MKKTPIESDLELGEAKWCGLIRNNAEHRKY